MLNPVTPKKQAVFLTHAREPVKFKQKIDSKILKQKLEKFFEVNRKKILVEKFEVQGFRANRGKKLDL